MKFCQKCGKELFDDALFCSGCGCAVENPNQGSTELSDMNIAFCVLSVFCPIFGLIYWALYRKKNPKGARMCGIAACITLAVSLVVWLITIYFAINIFSDLAFSLVRNYGHI